MMIRHNTSPVLFYKRQDPFTWLGYDMKFKRAL